MDAFTADNLKMKEAIRVSTAAYLDALAYLCVMGEDLPPGQEWIAKTRIIGCLMRLEAWAEKNRPELYRVIKCREQLNGYLPCGHPDLVEATRLCVEEVRKFTNP